MKALLLPVVESQLHIGRGHLKGALRFDSGSEHQLGRQQLLHRSSCVLLVSAGLDWEALLVDCSRYEQLLWLQGKVFFKLRCQILEVKVHFLFRLACPSTLVEQRFVRDHVLDLV